MSNSLNSLEECSRLKEELQKYKLQIEKYKVEPNAHSVKNQTKQNQKAIEELRFENAIFKQKLEELQANNESLQNERKEENKFCRLIESELILCKQKLINVVNFIGDRFGEEIAADVYQNLSNSNFTIS